MRPHLACHLHAIWERDTPSSKTFFAQGILPPRTLGFKADVCTNRVVTILSKRFLAVSSHQKQFFPDRLSSLSALTIIGTSQNLLLDVSIELLHLRRKVPYKIPSRNTLPTSTSNAHMGKISFQKLGCNKDILRKKLAERICHQYTHTTMNGKGCFSDWRKCCWMETWFFRKKKTSEIVDKCKRLHFCLLIIYLKANWLLKVKTTL